MRKLYDHIRQLVCDEYCVTNEELDSESGKRHIAEARMVAMKLVYEHTEMRVCQVSYMFGGRGHQCVYNASGRVMELCDIDPLFKRKYNRVLSAIQKTPQDLS